MLLLDLKKLCAPFPPEDLEWRIGNAKVENGRVTWASALVYLNARAIMDRLDEVCGPENWRNEFESWDGGVVCGIAINVTGQPTQPQWVVKYDGSEKTDIEAFKGGLTGAFKRAAVQWGIGRYLYSVKGMTAKIHDRGKLRGEAKDSGRRVFFRWDAPVLSFHEAEEEREPDQQPPEAKRPASPWDGGDWRTCVVHFGNLQGKSLGELTEKQLHWFQSEWLAERNRRGVLPDDESLYNALTNSMGGGGANPDPKDEIPF